MQDPAGPPDSSKPPVLFKRLRLRIRFWRLRLRPVGPGDLFLASTCCFNFGKQKINFRNVTRPRSGATLATTTTTCVGTATTVFSRYCFCLISAYLFMRMSLPFKIPSKDVWMAVWSMLTFPGVWACHARYHKKMFEFQFEPFLLFSHLCLFRWATGTAARECATYPATGKLRWVWVQ